MIKLKIKAFPKTSGKTGLHLYIPCKGFGFPEARPIAEQICNQINELVPDITTTAVTISHRGNKLYIDPSQNDEGDTVAAPYSVRPAGNQLYQHLWTGKKLMRNWIPKILISNTIFNRLDKKGDLFKDVMNKKIQSANSKILSKFLQ